MKAIQIDNFFEDVNLIYNECKKLKFYTQAEHPLNKDRITTTWPGKRTVELGECNLLLKYFLTKYYIINNLITPNSEVNFYVHARFDGDDKEEWIHQDKNNISSLIYLSHNNLQSGTKLYTFKNHQEINDFKFVQNRLIQYDGLYYHSAYGSHGTTIDNCRLTINGFIK